VICNGGSPTAYQALSQAAPVIGIPSNMDQLLAMRYIERFGAGVTQRAAQIHAGSLRTTVRRVLGDDNYRDRALALSRLFAQTNPYKEFSTLLHKLTGLANA
jgi:UDP:flavonoid glycosyltransferase YjiC (YdhE family)